MARHDNVGLSRVLFPALVVIAIVWDPAVTRRLAIVCFALALLFFLRRR
jgi:hypothetical protein